MNMATFIAGLAVILMLFFAIRYIYKEKKKGTACIGCPYAGSCAKHQAGQGCEQSSEQEIDRIIEDLKKKKKDSAQ